MTEQKQLLQSIIRKKAHHGRFLNTLALMELAGAQKISRLIPYIKSSTFLLEHAAEEYRHAYYLRKLANKINGAKFESFETDNVYCQLETKRYISQLDRRVCILLRQHGLHQADHIKSRAYILTTHAIESRAMPFYHSYQELLEQENTGISIRSIISEEEHHLTQIKEQLNKDKHILPLVSLTLTIENILFNSWLRAVQRSFNH